MDATYLRYLRTPASEAGGSERWRMRQKMGCRLLWHNESLSGEGQWAGWKTCTPKHWTPHAVDGAVCGRFGMLASSALGYALLEAAG